MKILEVLPFKNITNCCGRVLVGDAGDISVSGNVLCEDWTEGMLPPKCKFADVEIVGPYYLPGDRIEFKKITGDKVLFADDVSLSDINQGFIGDCWFLSAIDFSINHPLYKAKLHHNVSDVTGEDGIGSEKKARIKLYDTASGIWQETTVNTQTLVHETDIFPITYGVKSSCPEELWPAMLEKGLAKMCGGYPKIEGGLMSEGMSFLHGGRGYFVSSKDIIPTLLRGEISISEMFNDLRTLYEEGYGIFTAWERDMFSDTKEKGLVDGHAYSILDFKCMDDGEWVVKLKNPWGKFEWNGRYSDKDQSEKAIAVKATFGEVNADDGVFLMSAYDLFGRCEGLDIFEPLTKTVFKDRIKA